MGRGWSAGDRHAHRPRGNVTTVAFSRDGRLLASGSSDGDVKLWDVPTRTLFATLSGHNDTIETVAFSPVGRTLASAGRDEVIRL